MVNFVPEDGNGLNNANSYVSLAEASEIADVLGVDLFSNLQSDELKQKALIRATRYLEMNFSVPGIIAVGTQRLNWPRLNVVDDSMRAYTGVPQAIKEATVVLAGKSVAGTLFRDSGGTPTAQVKKQKIGPLEKEFFEIDPASAPYFGEVVALMRSVGGAYSGDGVTGFNQARIAR